MTRHARLVRTNGHALRDYRMERGLTQQELAKTSGYSTRLIRKAEASGVLDVETVRNIAEALSTENIPVSFHQLTLDNRAIAVQWMDAINEHGPDMANQIAHHLTEDFVLHCPGLPETAPFIGTWHGTEGLLKFWGLYHQIFRRVPHSDVTYSVAENLVIARYFESGYIGDQLCGPVRIHMVFHFRDGAIYRIDDDYDTQFGAITKKRAEDILDFRKSIVKRWIDCYDQGAFNLTDQLAGTTTEDFELVCSTEQTDFPFAGNWKGIVGAQRFFDVLKSYLSRVAIPPNVEYLLADNRFVAQFEETFCIDGRELPSCWVDLHFHFRDTQIYRLEYQLDQPSLKKDIANLQSEANQ